jgi:circadian clock protein KaiC
MLSARSRLLRLSMPPPLPRLSTGIPGLDEVLGGGLLYGDTLLVIGAPGSGKTVLTLQWAVHAAAAGQKVVYVSTLSEPGARLIKHVRTLAFWDERLLGTSLFIEHVYPQVKEGVLRVVEALMATVRARGASLLILDGLETLRDFHPNPVDMRVLLHELGTALAMERCGAVITRMRLPDGPTQDANELTLTDGVVELGQQEQDASASRYLRVWKMRGSACVLGLHPLVLDGRGLTVHPRFETRPRPSAPPSEAPRLSTGALELDRMMTGGLPSGSATVVAGAPGTGKTLLALQFLIAGANAGQKGVLLTFRESVEQLCEKARMHGLALQEAIAAGLVNVLRYVPVELQGDRVLSETWSAVERSGARRLVIDSLAEVERTLPSEQRRAQVMAQHVELGRTLGVTSLCMREKGQRFGPELDFSESSLELLAENVLLMRYAELEGQLHRILSILKMRNASHDHSVRLYDLGSSGVNVRSRSESQEGLLERIGQLPSERRVKRQGDLPTRGGGE